MRGRKPGDRDLKTDLKALILFLKCHLICRHLCECSLQKLIPFLSVRRDAINDNCNKLLHNIRNEF